MKKIIVLVITAAIALCFSSCIKIEQNNSPTETTTTTNANTQIYSYEMQSKLADELESDIEITVPACMFDENEPPSDELSQEQKEQGFKSARLNDDGSVTYTMSKNDSIMNMIIARNSAEDGIKNLGREYDFIKKMDYDTDYSTFRLYVDEKTYDKETFFNAAEEIGYSIAMYQIYANGNAGCTFEVYSNNNTSDMIDCIKYPQ